MITAILNGFKIITIEHDIYRGYEKSEAQPQRLLLEGLDYLLLCKNVTLSGNAFKNWWINPKSFNVEQYNHLICEKIGWKVSEPIKIGLNKTYEWIKKMV